MPKCATTSGATSDANAASLSRSRGSMRRNSERRSRRRGGTKSTPTISVTSRRSSRSCATRVPTSPPIPVIKTRMRLLRASRPVCPTVRKARPGPASPSGQAGACTPFGSVHAATTLIIRADEPSGLVAFEDDAQTVQREPRLVVLDRAGERHDQLGETTGRDHGARTELGDEAVDDRVDLTAEPVDHAGLDRLDRRLADHVARRHQLDATQRRGAAEERVHRDLHTGEDRAAEVLAL